MELTEQEKERLQLQALSSIVTSMKLNNIPLESVPKQIMQLLISVYIAGVVDGIREAQNENAL